MSAPHLWDDLNLSDLLTQHGRNLPVVVVVVSNGGDKRSVAVTKLHAASQIYAPSVSTSSSLPSFQRKPATKSTKASVSRLSDPLRGRFAKLYSKMANKDDVGGGVSIRRHHEHQPPAPWGPTFLTGPLDVDSEDDDDSDGRSQSMQSIFDDPVLSRFRRRLEDAAMFESDTADGRKKRPPGRGGIKSKVPAPRPFRPQQAWQDPVIKHADL